MLSSFYLPASFLCCFPHPWSTDLIKSFSFFFNKSYQHPLFSPFSPFPSYFTANIFPITFPAPTLTHLKVFMSCHLSPLLFLSITSQQALLFCYNSVPRVAFVLIPFSPSSAVLCQTSQSKTQSWAKYQNAKILTGLIWIQTNTHYFYIHTHKCTHSQHAWTHKHHTQKCTHTQRFTDFHTCERTHTHRNTHLLPPWPDAGLWAICSFISENKHTWQYWGAAKSISLFTEQHNWVG